MSVADQINENEEFKDDLECELSEVCSDRLSLVETDDEFFDSSETFLDDQSESICTAGFHLENYSQVQVLVQ